MKACHLKSWSKTSVLIFLILLFSCNDQSTEPDEMNPLIGTWVISKMTSVSLGETEIFDAPQLEEMGVIWCYTFKDDHTVEQITNISGSLLTMPGTWSVSGNQLTLILVGPNGTPGTLEYEYSIENDVLKLNWQIPAGPEFFAEFKKS